MANQKNIYRIQFHHQNKVYELYAHSIAQNFSYGFLEIADIIFGKHLELLVNPAEEKLKAEFAGVKRTYIPMQSVIRIDEVEKEGQNKIHEGSEFKSNVASFPMGIPKKPENK